MTPQQPQTEAGRTLLVRVQALTAAWPLATSEDIVAIEAEAVTDYQQSDAFAAALQMSAAAALAGLRAAVAAEPDWRDPVHLAAPRGLLTRSRIVRLIDEAMA